MKNSRFLIPFLGLVALILIQSYFLLRWARMDRCPLAWDQAIHVTAAYEYQDRWNAGSGAVEFLSPTYFNYPPLYHWSLLFPLAWLHDAADAGVVVNVFYFAALLLAVFLLGSRLRGPVTGLIAATFMSAYPIAIDMARETLIDLSLTAWVAWGVYALLRSEGFSRTGWSLAFGVIAAGGFLTKWTAPAYWLGVAVPLLGKAVGQRRWRGLIAALIPVVILALPWYVINFIPMLTRIGHVSNLPTANGFHLAGPLSVFWYPIELLEQMNLVGVIAFAMALFFFFRAPRDVSTARSEQRLILAWFVVSLVLFSLIRNHNVRYSLPALPAAALLIACALPVQFGWANAVSMSVAAMFFAAFHLSLLPRKIVRVAGSEIPFFYSRAPQPGFWQHDEVIRAIQRLKRADRLARVVTLANAPYFHSTTLNVTLRRLGITDVVFHGPAKKRWLELSDFILLKTGDLGPPGTTGSIDPCIDFLAKPPAWFQHAYKNVGRWPLPDGSEAILYHWDADVTPSSISIEVGSISLTWPSLDLPNIHAQDVRVILKPSASVTESRRGVFRSMDVNCARIDYKTLRFNDVHVHFDEPIINVPLFKETGEIQLVSVKSLEPSATLPVSTLLDYAARKAAWVANPSVDFSGPTVTVRGQVKGVAINIEADVWVDDRVFRSRVRRLRIGRFPFPLILLRSATDQYIPLRAGPDLAYDLGIARIEGQGTSLRLEGGP